MSSGVQIKIISDENIVDSIFWHKRISLGRKDFGLLMGNVIEEGETSIIYIEDIFPVGKLSNASKILEDAEWLDIRSKAVKKHPNKEIVGWYGVRNGWGAMMMEEDQYIHKNYFMGLWQVMYLLDDKGGFRNFYTWEGDSLALYKKGPQDESLEHLKADRESDIKTSKESKKHPKWLYVVLAVAILATISYPRYIRPFFDRQQADKGKLESASSDREQSDEAAGEQEDDIEMAALKEVIKGLENALDETGRELELKQQQLDDKTQELEEKIKELEEKNQALEEKEQKIKELEDAKVKAESGQDDSKMRVYQFQDGDTLSGLSDKFYGSVKYSSDLGRINRITDHNSVRTGTYLIIPPLEMMETIHGRNTTSGD